MAHTPIDELPAATDRRQREPKFRIQAVRLLLRLRVCRATEQTLREFGAGWPDRIKELQAGGHDVRLVHRQTDGVKWWALFVGGVEQAADE